MLSLEICRRILGDEVELSKNELDELRSIFYGLAQMVLSAVPNHDLKTHALDEEPEERAAIIEYDAGLPRPLAELIALDLQRGKHDGLH